MIAMLLAGAYFVSSKTAAYKWMLFVAGGWWLCAILIIVLPEGLSYQLCAITTFFLEFVCGLFLRFVLYKQDVWSERA